MPNAERIADLQRLAYGAGATDSERHAALAELERTDPVGLTAQAQPADPISPAHEDRELDAAAASGRASGGEAGPSEPPTAPWGLVRTSAIIGVIALGTGLGVGWAAGSVTAPDPGPVSPASSADSSADQDVVLVLPDPNRIERVSEPVPLAEAPAMAVFEREQVETDRTPIATGGDPMFDPLTQRRLITLADGGVFSAALDEAGMICLAFDRPEGGGAAVCTGETSFPPEGLYMDSMFESRTMYELHWYASGEVRVLRTPAG